MMIDELNLVHDYTSRVDYVANLLSRCMHACALSSLVTALVR